MTSEELKREVIKQQEREYYEGSVNEYLRVKKLVAEAGDLTHDEICNIALLVCRSQGTFDIGPCRIR